jgi:hypothetical protein
MAGISKLRLKYYGDFKDLIVWCIKHNPSLLDNIYEPFMSTSEWNLRKTFSEDYREYTKVVVADFRFKQDRWLYWHCPLDFIREYLETQCGYKKANWFVKLFWKY